MGIFLLPSTKEELDLLSSLMPYETALQEWGEKVNEEDIPQWEPLESIVQLPEINDSFFASWKTADIPVILLAGLAGALGSYFTRDFFAKIHDHWGKTPASSGGHAGESIDRVPGADQAGGWGHRWQHGHDLLNPFQIDWSQYQQMAQDSNTVLPIWMKAAFYWIRHLVQDTFSKEGLPIPGHSYGLQFLNWIQHLFSGGEEGSTWLDPQRDHEMLKIFGTIKARDVTGTVLTTLIMKLYLWGTEDSWSKANSKQNYRTCSLMLGAYWVNLCTGLIVPQKAKTLNISVIPLIARYSWALVKINLEISKLLQERDEVLAGNWIIIKRNQARIEAIATEVKQKIKTLDAVDDDLYQRYNAIVSKRI